MNSEHRVVIIISTHMYIRKNKVNKFISHDNTRNREQIQKLVSPIF